MLLDTPQLNRTYTLRYWGTCGGTRRGFAGSMPLYDLEEVCIRGTGVLGQASDCSNAIWSPWDDPSFAPPTVAFDGDAGAGNYGVGLYATTLGSATHYAADAHPLPSPKNWTYGVACDWEFTIQADELRVMEYPDPTEDTYVDGVPFHVFAQNAMPDGLPSLRDKFILVGKSGGVATATITAGGATATVTQAIPAGTVLSFFAPTMTSVGSASNYSGSYYATWHWDADNPRNPEYSYTETPSGYGPASIDVTAASDGISMSATCANTVLTDGCDTPTVANYQATMTIAPPYARRYKGRIRVWDQPAPDEGLSVVFPAGVDSALNPKSSTPVSGGSFDSGTVYYRGWSIQAILNGVTQPLQAGGEDAGDAQMALSGMTRTPPDSDPDHLEYNDVEDRHDRKMYIRGHKHTAGTIALASSVTPTITWDRTTLDAANPTATGTLTGINRVWEAYRYFNLPLTGHGFANRDVAVSLVNAQITKEFKPTTGADGSTVTRKIDGCAPTNVPTPFDVDRRRSRFPTLNQPTHSQGPIQTGPEQRTAMLDDQEGWDVSEESVVGHEWGPTRVDSVQVSCALSGSETLDLGTLTLTTTLTPKITFLQMYPCDATGYGGYRRVWTYTAAGGDTTPVGYVRSAPFSYLDADGRGFVDLLSFWRDEPVASDPSFVYPTISDWFGWMNAFLGVTATEATGFSSYWDNSTFIQWLGGDGDVATVADDGTVTWTSYIDHALGAIEAQELLARVRHHPFFGNGLNGGGFGGVTVFASSKVLRARAEGIVLDSETLAPVPGGTINTVDDLTGSTSGTGTTASNGFYATTLPYGRAAKSHTTSYGSVSDTATWRNREKVRTSFLHLIERALGRALGIDVSRSGRWVRVYEHGGTLRIGASSNYLLPFGWSERDTGIAVDWGRCRFLKVGTKEPLFILVGSSGSLSLYRLDTEGGTPTLSHTIGSGDAGDLWPLTEGVLATWRKDSGAVYVRRFRGDGTEIGTEQATNLTGLDDGTSIAVASYPDPQTRKRRIGILHTVGGALIVRLSDDGITFDA